MRAVWLLTAIGMLLPAQEAESGLELRTTLSAMAAASNLAEAPPRGGAPGVAGGRAAPPRPCANATVVTNKETTTALFMAGIRAVRNIFSP